MRFLLPPPIDGCTFTEPVRTVTAQTAMSGRLPPSFALLPSKEAFRQEQAKPLKLEARSRPKLWVQGTSRGQRDVERKQNPGGFPPPNQLKGTMVSLQQTHALKNRAKASLPEKKRTFIVDLGM